MIKKEILNSIKTEIKIANDETLKKVEENISNFPDVYIKKPIKHNSIIDHS